MELDGKLIKKEGHDYLKNALDLPDYYGGKVFLLKKTDSKVNAIDAYAYKIYTIGDLKVLLYRSNV